MKSTQTVRLSIFFIFALGTTVGLYLMAPRIGYPKFDDAYVFIRYAKHFINGDGFCWNAGEKYIYGCTSLLYLICVTFLRWLISASDGFVLSLASLIPGLAACILTATACALATTQSSLKQYWVHLLVIPTLLLLPEFRYHLGTGMETMLSMMLNALLLICLFAYCRLPSKKWLVACITAAYLSFLVRPDNGLYSLLLPPLYIISGGRMRTKAAVHYMAIFLGVLVIDTIAKKLIFGDILPLSFYAKTNGFYTGYLGYRFWNMGQYIYEFLLVSAPFAISIVLFVNRRSCLQILALLFPVVLTFCYFFTVVQITGFHARYLMPALPFVVVSAFIAIDRSHAYSRSSRNGISSDSLPVRISVLFVLVVFLTSQDAATFASSLWEKNLMSRSNKVEAQTKYKVPANKRLPVVGWWEGVLIMNEIIPNLPHGTVVAMSEHGLIGASAPHIKILDLVGLQNPHIAHNKFDANYVFSEEVDFF